MTAQTLNQPAFHADSYTAWRGIVLETREPQAVTVFYPPLPRDEDRASLYEAEKAAFESLRPSLEQKYLDKYVAVHRGEVVDSDASRLHLARRFFTTHGDTHVYIGYVGRPPVAHQLTPFTF